MLWPFAKFYNKIQQLKYLTRTGIVVDIENLGKNTKCIAVPEKNSLEEIRPGVWFGKSSASLSKDNFANIYDVYYDPKQFDICPKINSSNELYSLADQMEKDPSAIAVINGAFFFLTDFAERQPLDLPYNLWITNNKILGLPSWDQPIAYVENGKLKAQETSAVGTIKINNETLNWVGANSKSKGKENFDAVLYNSKCSDVVKIRQKETNIQIGILDNENIYTPKKSTVTDITIGKDKDNNLIIFDIKKGGGTHFFDGIIILQIENSINTFALGDRVTPLTLDGLDLQKMSTGITIGRSVHDPFFLEKVRVDRQDCRSLIAEDVDGCIHFMAFDGSKYIPGFGGVSAKDLHSFFSADKFKWAYFLDGGGSSRIVVRQNGKLKFLANEFAFRKSENGAIVWDWKKARTLTSSISIRIKGQ